MTLEPLLGSTALYRADVPWNTSSKLCGYGIGTQPNPSSCRCVPQHLGNIIDVMEVRPRLLARHFFIDNPLVRIHLIIEMTLVDRPCTIGV